MKSGQELPILSYDVAQDLLKVNNAILEILQECQHDAPNMEIIKSYCIDALKKLPINNYSDTIKYS